MPTATDRNRYTMSPAALAARRKGRETMKARAVPKTTIRVSAELADRIAAACHAGEPIWKALDRLLTGRC